MSSISLDQLCRILDLRPRRIQKLASDGVIPRSSQGWYDLVGSVRGYIEFLRERVVASETGVGEYRMHRARLTKARADMAEMERAQIAAELIPADDVEKAWAAIKQAIEVRLGELPSQIAPRLVAITDISEAQDVLRSYIYEALEELAGLAIEVSAA